jgi:hypothetical protein
MSNFHIHVDALNISLDFQQRLIHNLGFWRSDFSGHPEGAEHYEPPHHLTQKTADSKEFKELFDRIVEHARAPHAMKGYIEGEFVPLDKDLVPRPFDVSVPMPFKLQRTFLPAGAFRETEVHVTLDRDRSHPQLLRNLLEMGLFAAYLPKVYGTAAIFTAQGSRAHIDVLLPSLTAYLERAGGAVECSIKEERIAHWWMSEPDLPLPPVVESIEWAR